MVMLSSLTDLLHFIDENQLSTEFGGTLDECHSDWIVLQTVSILIHTKAAYWFNAGKQDIYTVTKNGLYALYALYASQIEIKSQNRIVYFTI